MDIFFLTLILASQIQLNFGQNSGNRCKLLNENQTYTCEDVCAGASTAECGDSLSSMIVTVDEFCSNSMQPVIDMVQVVNCTGHQQSNPDLDRIIIIAAASGGGGALLIICLLALCCCCCCCARQRRKRRSINLQANSTVETPMIPLEDTPSVENDLPNGGNNITMKPNIALSDASSPDDKHTPLITTSFVNNGVKKSASSYEIRSRNNGSLGEDKGYIKMSSAGSVHSLCTPQDQDDIYDEPDLTITSSQLLLPSSTTPTTPTHPPPTTPTHPPPSTRTPTHPPPSTRTHTPTHPPPTTPTHPPPTTPTHPPPTRPPPTRPPPTDKKRPATMPKPAGLQGSTASGQKSPHPVAAASTSVEGSDSSSENEDDYESPQVFKEDLKKQSAEDYYNKDAVIIPATEPSIDKEPQTLYENLSVDVASDGEDNGSYESVKNYLIGGDEEEGKDRSSTVYYNIPEGVGGPNIDNEDETEDEEDMYMYMQAGHHMEQEPGPVPQGKPAKERRRNQSEHLGQNKKYMNFNSEQKLQVQQYLAGEGNKADSAIDEAPLYANFDEEVEEEELYTAVT